MEDRLAGDSSQGRGAALIALAAIAVITAAWWALALWPAGAVEPDWLTRTRAACFGSERGGLPHAGGWVLLIGEPIGMLAVLWLLFGEELRRDLAWIGQRRYARFVVASIGALTVLVITLVVVRVAGGWSVVHGNTANAASEPVRVDRAVPDAMLVDERGNRMTLRTFRGQSVLLTFAFGHCATVCPTVVRDLQRARSAANRDSVPIVILTLDPWRDTPDRLPTIAQHWELTGEDRVLSGAIADVNAALDELGIGRQRNTTTGDVDHAAAVMIVDERGSVAWRVAGGPRELAALLAKL